MSIRSWDPSTLFNLMEEQMIASSTALTLAMNRASSWTVADEWRFHDTHRTAIEKARKICAHCGAESRYKTRDTGLPFFCTDKKECRAARERWRSGHLADSRQAKREVLAW